MHVQYLLFFAKLCNFTIVRMSGILCRPFKLSVFRLTAPVLQFKIKTTSFTFPVYRWDCRRHFVGWPCGPPGPWCCCSRTWSLWVWGQKIVDTFFFLHQSWADYWIETKLFSRLTYVTQCVTLTRICIWKKLILN